MQESLKAGIELERTYVVTPDMSPAHLDRLVLSTPAMVNLVEITCLELAVRISTTARPQWERTSASATSCRRCRRRDRRHQPPRRSRSAAAEFRSAGRRPAGRLSEGTHQRAVVAQDYVDGTAPAMIGGSKRVRTPRGREGRRSAMLLTGDYFGMLLADEGADVVKIESPGYGDYIRDHMAGRASLFAVPPLRQPQQEERHPRHEE